MASRDAPHGSKNSLLVLGQFATRGTVQSSHENGLGAWFARLVGWFGFRMRGRGGLQILCGLVLTLCPF